MYQFNPKYSKLTLKLFRSQYIFPIKYFAQYLLKISIKSETKGEIGMKKYLSALLIADIQKIPMSFTFVDKQLKMKLGAKNL